MKIRDSFPLLFALVVIHAKADEREVILPSGVGIVTIGEQRPINDMAIYPFNGIAGRPLLIVSHGNGGSGRGEIKDWFDIAKQHNITVVCPTFLSSSQWMQIPDDKPYFRDCLDWIEHHLIYDKSNTYMTGFSGGGYAVWYLGTTRPDFFKGLFFQSCNFTGNQYFELDLSRWTEKPIHLVWGTEDSPTVIAQNKRALEFLNSTSLKNYSFEILPGAHHEPHRDLVVSWLEKMASFNH